MARWYERTIDGTVLGPVRVVVGVLLFWHGVVAARELADTGYFGDAFHVGYLPDRWLLPKVAYAGFVAVRIVLAALVVLGLRARAALFASALFALYPLLANTLDYHHERYILACYALLLSLTPCGGSALLANVEAGLHRTGLEWGVTLCRLQVAIVYLASGGSKLLDADWRSGAVLLDPLVFCGLIAEARGIPHAIVALLATPTAASVLAKLAVVTQLTLAPGLLVRRARVVALWWGTWFHLVIVATGQFEIFTWLTLAMYGTFAVPDRRARSLRYDPTSAGGRLVARIVRLTDWLYRFQVRPWEPDGLAKTHTFVVVRRDGTRATSLSAIAMISRSIPLFFPLWAPLAFLASFRKDGDASLDA